MANAEKTDPKLWEKVKQEYMDSDKGGESGQWSARKAQLSVKEYKRRGGGYEDDGAGQGETDLHQWTEEDWGTKSGEESAETGERYLPKKVRMLLTEAEYQRSTSKKKSDSHAGDEQFSDQPDDVKEKVAKIKKGGPTKAMLTERAQDLDISGRSDMTKDELLEAIEKATDENGRAKHSEAGLRNLTKAELYEKAQETDIEGRSSMSKDELIHALTETE
ncbi:MAG: Rho termination factor N-terminal domain-containing protein [Phormidesmis sp.]